MEFCRVYHEIKAPTNRQYGKPEISGKIVFTPDLQKGEVWTDNGVVVPALPITCDVIDGTMYDRNGEHPSRYAHLMAGGPDANPNTMNWRVSYHDMRVGDEHFYIEPFIFKAIPYVKVNLAHVSPVAGYTPPGVIRGATGSPGIGIIFKGIVLTQDDLPVDGVENNHAYAITNTKDLAVWQDNEWLIIPNFANFDVSLEALSDLLYEARKNAEYSQGQVVEMDRLHALAEKYSQAARDAVDLGRSYIRKMEDHVSASTTAAGKAEDLAAQAAAAAAEAVTILDQLNPLRDDVDAAHTEVTRLHGEASQLTEQAAEHVRQASQHAADAVASATSASNHAADGKRYAEDALAHAEEGKRQAGLAAGSATSALQNANRAQQIMDDADEVLSQVQGYSQDAKNALAAAEAILGNVDGSGKSLGDVLLEVANKHQQVLGAHDDILDLHTEVLQKHGEAINYVAAAAAQAGTAAMHASMAAQEALDVATNAAQAAESASFAADDASAAASSAGQAADEAAAAAENNRQAIGKLQEADGKLQEADQKLQEQIDVLEDSQTVLAEAVSLLSAATAQASMAARHASQAANNAGDAAVSALDAIDAMNEAYTIFTDTQALIDAEQNEIIGQIAQMQKELVEQSKGQINQILATKTSTSWPGVNTYPVGTGRWGMALPDSAGALVHVEWLRDTGSRLTRVVEKVGYPYGGWVVDAADDEIVKVSWAKVGSVQRDLSTSSGAFTPSKSSTWTTVPGASIQAYSAASNGYIRLKVTWAAASRGSTYGIRFLVDGQPTGAYTTTTLGPYSFIGDGEKWMRNSISNVKVPAGRSVQFQVYCSNSGSSARRVKKVEVEGSWIEIQ